MNAQSVQQFLLVHGNKFPRHSIQRLHQNLLAADENTSQMLASTSLKSPDTALLLSILTGSLGIDRFYVGDTMLGVVKLVTAGGCGIWWLLDLFFIRAAARQNNLGHFMRNLHACGL